MTDDQATDRLRTKINFTPAYMRGLGTPLSVVSHVLHQREEIGKLKAEITNNERRIQDMDRELKRMRRERKGTKP